jgi:predicted MFS family arabinose efflux permease
MGRGLGIMVGALIGGLPFDLQGNYFVAFILEAVLMVVAVGCMRGASFSGSQRCTFAEGRLM